MEKSEKSVREESIHEGVLTTIVSPVSGKELDVVHDVDEAMKLAIQNKAEHIELDEVSAKKLRRKIDMYVLPLMMILYCFQFMDKLSNSYASILGLRTDMKMHGDQYSWTGSAFYLGYLVFEFPTSFLLQKFPVIKTVGIFTILWGFVIAMGALANYPGFIAIRTIQGGLESIITPAFTLYTTFWYTKEESFFITTLWFASNGIGQILGSGAIAYNIYRNEDSYSLAPWKIVFITVGCLTIFLGILMMLHLPDTPAKAWFLTEREKALVVERIRVNQQGFGNRHFKKEQFIEALTDIKVWIFAIFAFANNVPNGGLTNFGSILLNSDLGYSVGKSLLMQMPSGAIEFIGCSLFAYCYRFYPSRLFWAFSASVITFVAQCMLTFSHNNKVQLAGYSLNGLLPIGFTCVLACIGTNILGTTKKQTASAIYLIFYCVGNLVGPQTFKAKDAPSYTSAKLAIVICSGGSLVLMIILWLVLIWENKKKDRAPVQELNIENIEFADLTDKENPHFRYVI